jgi:hypothetical protein
LRDIAGVVDVEMVVEQANDAIDFALQCRPADRDPIEGDTDPAELRANSCRMDTTSGLAACGCSHRNGFAGQERLVDEQVRG